MIRLPLAVLLTVAPTAAAQVNPFTIRPGWPITLTGSSVDGGLLTDLDGDADLELVQVVGDAIHAFDADATPVAGWPVTLDLSFGTFSAPAAGDIDGDGQVEIVVSTFFFGIDGQLWALERDGSVVAGFPRSLGGSVKAPALADLDGDGALEILVVTNVSGFGRLLAVDSAGNVLPGWPQIFDDVGGSGPSVGDVDGDGTPEVFAPSYRTLYGFEPDGTALPGFPASVGVNQRFNYNSVTLVDLDGDGDRELVTATSTETGFPGRAHVLEHDGTPRAGWPQSTTHWTFSPPSVADIDGDGLLDVAIGDQRLSATPINKLYAWDRDGNALPGFPVGPMDAVHAQTMIADVDADGFVELLFDDNVADSGIECYGHDGTPAPGWPLDVQGSSFLQTPNFADVDNDGFLDMAGSGNLIAQGDTVLYLWTSNLPWNSDDAPVATYQYGPKRDGVADPDDCPAVQPYCTAKINSQGCAPAIATSGQPSLSDPTPFVVSASMELNNKPGLLFYGFAAATIPFLGGTLCAQPPLRRTPIQFSGGNAPPDDCSGAYAFDLNAWAQGGNDANLAADVDAFLQYWSRDPAAASPSALSNAAQIRMCP